MLAVLALGAGRFDTQWTLFAVAAMAILALTSWRSAPAAAAAALAGVVSLGAIATWPGLMADPEPRLLAPAMAEVLRIPDNVSRFMIFTIVSTLAVGLLATLRLERGRALPVTTAGLYALAAIVPSLLALILAYLRVTQFDRSIPFALFSVVLAADFYLAGHRFGSLPEAVRTPATRLATGAFAAGVAAAITLAFVMVLERGYLTVAFAVTALTTAIVAGRHRIPLLRAVVAALGFMVLGRLLWDPRIMGTAVGTWPIFNWLLLGYGVPAIAFLAAGDVLRREREDLAVRICDALGVLFAALLFFYEIRHALNGGDPLANASGHVEQGLFALMSLGFAYVLMRLDLGRANPVFRFASLAFGVLSAVFIVFGLGIVENPLLNSERIAGVPIFSSLLLAYLVPGASGGAAGPRLAGRAARLVRDGRRRARHAAAVRLRHAGGAPPVPGRRHRGVEARQPARDLVLLGGLAGAGPGLPCLRHRARHQGAAPGLRRARVPVRDQGVPVRPDGHRRAVAGPVRDLPRRRPDRHRPRLPEADLRPAAGGAAAPHLRRPRPQQRVQQIR